MIDIPTAIRISFRALKRNKMRSALTMLGIIIGVGAVIAMLSIGMGASKRIADQISSIGSNLIMILPGATTSAGVRMGSGTQITLTIDDAEAIQNECPAVSDVAPVHNGVAQVVFGSQNWSTAVTGTTPGMLAIRDWSLDSG
ncbi:MAG: ABC transporter permease, partial [Desulfomonilaceae bacterium]|nr:ABC transporter permease [Desulfomonilaceae bacterium]